MTSNPTRRPTPPQAHRRRPAARMRAGVRGSASFPDRGGHPRPHSLLCSRCRARRPLADERHTGPARAACPSGARARRGGTSRPARRERRTRGAGCAGAAGGGGGRRGRALRARALSPGGRGRAPAQSVPPPRRPRPAPRAGGALSSVCVRR